MNEFVNACAARTIQFLIVLSLPAAPFHVLAQGAKPDTIVTVIGVVVDQTGKPVVQGQVYAAPVTRYNEKGESEYVTKATVVDGKIRLGIASAYPDANGRFSLRIDREDLPGSRKRFILAVSFLGKWGLATSPKTGHAIAFLVEDDHSQMDLGTIKIKMIQK